MTGDDIRFAVVGNIYTSFTRGGKRCLRQGNMAATVAQRRKGARGQRIERPPHCVSLVSPGERWEDAHVYLVSLSEEFHKRWYKQPKNFYVVALHNGAVESHLKRRYGSLPTRYAGLARYTLGVAMRRTSTRNAETEPGVDRRVPRIAEANVSVTTSTGETYTIHVVDSLRYAALALKGGRSDVQFCMMKAANSIAGRLSKVAGAGLAEKIPTPFPEVRG